MRTSITIGFAHDSEKTILIHGSEVPFTEQLDAFKGLPVERENKEFRSIQIWDSGAGCVKERRFDKPGTAEAKKKQHEEHLAAAKAKAEAAKKIEPAAAKQTAKAKAEAAKK